MTTNDKGKRKKDLADQQETSAPARQDAEAGPAPKMKRKEYEREMRLLHGELVALQEWVKASGAKVCIVFEGRDTRRQGRHDQADHRAGEPAGLPGRRPARSDRAREVADVHPALHPALPGGRRGRDLRPQLVQPGRRRAGDGLLHRGAAERFLELVPGVEKAMVDSGISAQVLARGRAPTSRPGAWRAASTTRARSGSSPPWT